MEAQPPNYAWYFNTNNLIVGATNEKLTLAPTLANMAGKYELLATNIYGRATSALASLTVLLRPNFYGITNVANSKMILNLASTPKSKNRVWVSTNLNSPIAKWQSIATNVAGTNGLFQFTDTNLTGKPVKFYRISQP